MHVVPSTKETVQLGVYDTNLPPILTIDSGDSISFPDTWSHFLNELQPGVPISTLARLRMDNPGRGPQSIIGPIAVKRRRAGRCAGGSAQADSPLRMGCYFQQS